MVSHLGLKWAIFGFRHTDGCLEPQLNNKPGELGVARLKPKIVHFWTKWDTDRTSRGCVLENG